MLDSEMPARLLLAGFVEFAVAPPDPVVEELLFFERVTPTAIAMMRIATMTPSMMTARLRSVSQ